MTRPTRHACIALAFLLLSAVPGWSQAVLDKRLSIDVNAVPPQQVLESIARTMNYELKVLPGATEPAPVTIHLDNVTARTALQALCDSSGCRWSLSGRALTVTMGADVRARKVLAKDVKLRKTRLVAMEWRAKLNQPLPAGMRFDKTPLREAVAKIGSAAGVVVEIEGDVKDRTVTGDVSNLPLVAGLRKLVRDTDSSGTFSITVSGGEGDRPMRIKIAMPSRTARKVIKKSRF